MWREMLHLIPLRLAFRWALLLFVASFGFDRLEENGTMAFATLDPGRISPGEPSWSKTSARDSVAYAEFIRKNLLKNPEDAIKINVPSKTQSDNQFVKKLREKVPNIYLFPSSMRTLEDYSFELTLQQKQQLDRRLLATDKFGNNIFHVLVNQTTDTHSDWGIFVFEQGDKTHVYTLPLDTYLWGSDS